MKMMPVLPLAQLAPPLSLLLFAVPWLLLQLRLAALATVQCPLRMLARAQQAFLVGVGAQQQ